jgi:TonB-linked SusC/RagA family outer membrane protein
MDFLNLRSFKALFTGILLMTAAVAFSQHTVTGTVKDMDGNTLPGVNVTIQGTTVGTITDVQGQYKLDVPGNDAVLVFSFIGYANETLTVGDQKNIDIKLMPDIEALSEVLVIGYGTMKKEDKTGAVVQVTTDEMQGGILTDAVQAIQGRSAGVLVTKQGGDPNGGFSIRIRGAAGFNSSTTPLYVVDGVPGVDPSTVAPEDIKSFDILKDAASTAIYGSQGSNGVIFITTKTGAPSSSQQKGFVSNVNFNSKASIDFIENKYDLMSADDVRNWAQKLANESGQNVEDIFNDGGANTDWQDEIFRTGFSYSNNINFSGSAKNSSYYASITNSNWTGIMEGTEKERTIAKVNINHSGLNDRLKIYGSLSGTFEQNDYESYGENGQKDIIYQALLRNPTDPVYNDDGSYYQSDRIFNYENPMAVINEVDNVRDAKRFFGKLKADLEIIDGLVASVNTAYTRNDHESSIFDPANLFAAANDGYAKKQYENKVSKLLELTGTYTKEFGMHNINGLLGYSWQEEVKNGFMAQAWGATSTYLNYNNLQQFTVYDRDIPVNSWKSGSKLIGYFARAQYNYNHKYYFTASIRRDGSSKFGEDNKWGWFPTASLAWKVSEESFMPNLSWLETLKLRASWGISGNEKIGEYRSQVTYSTFQGADLSGNQTVIYTGGWNENPDLQWEETQEFNIGFDFGLLNNRISGSFDVFTKITDHMLLENRVDVPPYVYTRTWMNNGKISNTGFEFHVQAFVLDMPNVKWETRLNISHFKTKLVEFNEDVKKEGYINARGMVGEENYVISVSPGEEMGTFYLPEYVTTINGEMVFVSENGGYTTDFSSAKRSKAGNATPDLEIGWANTIKLYDNWVIDFSFRSLLGHQMYNATAMIMDNPNDLPNINTLTSANDWYNLGRTSPPTISDYYVENASFLRLDYLSVGYEFNVDKLDWLGKLKVYAASNNLFTITGYSGIDPEPNVNGISYGIDQYNVYPKSRTITFGINATF